MLLDGNRVCLIERKRQGLTYYLFPGGGVEEGETPEQSAVREAYEELGVEVELGRLVSRETFRGDQQLVFLARIVGGVFGTGTGPEMSSTSDSKNGTYTPVWLPLTEALKRDVRPRELCQALLDGALEPDKVLELPR